MRAMAARPRFGRCEARGRKALPRTSLGRPRPDPLPATGGEGIETSWDFRAAAATQAIPRPSAGGEGQGERRRAARYHPSRMIPSLRRAYNAAYTDEKYRTYKRRLSERGGMEIPFHLAETPFFLPPELRDEMVSASLDIFRQLSTPEALHGSLSAVPPHLDVPGADEFPVFAVVDFAVTKDSTRQARAEADRAPGLPDALRLPGRAVRGARAPLPRRRQARLVPLRPRHRRLQARRRRGDPLRPRARRKSSCSTSTRRTRRPRSTSPSPSSSGA